MYFIQKCTNFCTKSLLKSNFCEKAPKLQSKSPAFKNLPPTGKSLKIHPKNAKSLPQGCSNSTPYTPPVKPPKIAKSTGLGQN